MPDNNLLSRYFYKVKSRIPNHRSFPYPGRRTEATTRIKVNFEDTENFLMITVEDQITIDYGDENTQNFNPDVTFDIDQTLDEVMESGIIKEKIRIEGMAGQKARMSKILNALDLAYVSVFGGRVESQRLHF